MSRTYVETSSYLLEEVDEMIQEGFYRDRTEAVNDALTMLIKQYKVSKLHAKDLSQSAAGKAAAKKRGAKGGPK